MPTPPPCAERSNKYSISSNILSFSSRLLIKGHLPHDFYKHFLCPVQPGSNISIANVQDLGNLPIAKVIKVSWIRTSEYISGIFDILLFIASKDSSAITKSSGVSLSCLGSLPRSSRKTVFCLLRARYRSMAVFLIIITIRDLVLLEYISSILCKFFKILIKA